MNTIQLLKTTKTVQKLSLLCLTAGLLSSVASAQTSLYIENPGFELPGGDKINGGFDASGRDILGWMDAGVNTDDGVEWAVWGNSGSYSGYCTGGHPGAYQVTTNTMEWGKKYTLTWYMAIDYSWSDSSQTVNILSADATNTPFANCTQTAVFSQSIPANNTWHGPWSQYSVSFVSGSAQIGKYIGMSFACGNQWISFDDFALTVQDASPAELALSITTPPVGMSVYEADSIVLTATVTGPDPVYQWQAGAPGSGIYTNVPGATNATLTIAAAELGDTADYILYVTNQVSSATSSVAAVTVSPATYVNGLFNGDFELPAMNGITSGFDMPGMDVPGWKNAGPNQNDSGMENSGSGHTGSYSAKTQKGQSGAYQITTNVFHLGDSITLTWWDRNAWQGLSAKVSLLSASSQGAAFGSTTTLVSQTNVVGADYDWHSRSITYTAGAGDVGKLLGVFLGSADTTTGGWGDFDDFNLVVTPAAAAPVVVTPPANQTVWLASTAIFTVVASGSGLGYQWQSGVVGSGIYANISNGGQFSGANTASLTITNVAVANGADYVVILSNTGGSVTSTPAATLTVNTDGPYFGATASRTVYQYDTTTIAPEWVSGATAYQWQAGAVGTGVYTNLANDGHFSGINTATLTIANVALADGLDYVLVASNAAGSSTNSPATLTVTPVIYVEAFNTSSTNDVSAVGWVADRSSGQGTLSDGGWPGTCLWAAGNTGVPQAFYTTTLLENGSIPGQIAFPVICLTNVTGMTFYVDYNSWWGATSTHTYFAVQMNWGAWYVQSAELTQATGNQQTGTLAFDPTASAWNQLTVTGTGTNANDATTTVIGSSATNDLTGYVTGAGLVTLHDGSSWIKMDNFRIIASEYTAVSGLSLALSGANVVLTWGYGTLVESTNVTGPWTAVSGATSPKTVPATGDGHFYRLQLP